MKRFVVYAFETFDIARISSGVFTWNPASAQVLEKAGFTLEGKLRQHVFKDGRYTDLLMYGILRDEVTDL